MRYVIDGNGCHVWQGAKGAKGYGQKWCPLRRRVLGAHRLAYEAAHGAIPNGLHIDHLCRNPSCVNPAHMEPVTPAENSRRGVNTRLTDEQVAEIRTRVAAGETRRALAMEFAITPQYAGQLAAGRWRVAA